jgi:hypothetical protein
MNGLNLLQWQSLLTSPTLQVTAVADFNADGKDDLLWYDPVAGQTSNWLMDGTALLSQNLLFTDPFWRVTTTGDFNGDGITDLLWQYPDGETAVWLMNGATVSSYASISSGAPGLIFR